MEPNVLHLNGVPMGQLSIKDLYRYSDPASYDPGQHTPICVNRNAPDQANLDTYQSQ